MSNSKKIAGLNVETLVLVTVWERPFIFQGCFKIIELQKNNPVFFFFRCQSTHATQQDILNNYFSAADYAFTHLYNESGYIELAEVDPVKEYALDMMKYALHVTLREMITRRKLDFTSIDDVAMQAIINKVRPILNGELALPQDESIGFAVAMDFTPQEDLGYLAAAALLKKLENQGKFH